MLTAKQSFKKTCHTHFLLCIQPDTKMPAVSDVDHKNKLLKSLKGGMNIHTGIGERTQRRGLTAG